MREQIVKSVLGNRCYDYQWGRGEKAGQESFVDYANYVASLNDEDLLDLYNELREASLSYD